MDALRIQHAVAGDGHPVVRLAGDLDLSGAVPLERELRRVEAAGAREIELDLSRLSFLDSTGVELILAVQSRARAAGRALSLRRGPAVVQRVFDLTRTATRLPFRG